MTEPQVDGREEPSCKGLTSIQVVPEWKEGHVQGDVSHSWIGLEDGNDSKLNKHEENRVLPTKETKRLLR